MEYYRNMRKINPKKHKWYKWKTIAHHQTTDMQIVSKQQLAPAKLHPVLLLSMKPNGLDYSHGQLSWLSHLTAPCAPPASLLLGPCEG